MKILSAEQFKEADQATIENQKITSDELMERAATLVFKEIHRRLEHAKIPIRIFCGIGNNGGDGLVVARHLLEEGYEVTVYVVNYSDKRSPSFLVNYDRIKNVTKKWPILLTSTEDFPEIKSGDFVVDAVFGLGLNRPLVPWVADLVRHINRSGAFVLAIDMPSGMMADSAVEDLSTIIHADFTISFQAPKLAFFLPDTAGFVGDLQIVDIGLDRDYLQEVSPIGQLISNDEAKVLYRSRKKFSHKGDFGHVLLVGGSYGKIGSMVLAASAALKSGAGLITVFIPRCGYNILQTAVPEAMVLTDRNEEILENISYDFQPTTIGFGVGAGKSKVTVDAFRQLLRKVEESVVIDADGLNILSENPDLLELLPEASILSPHEKELERLVGKWKNDFEKIEKVKALARKHKLIILIKGAYTCTVTPEEIYINSSGNPGMATAGSGDVLTGILTSLLGQGYEPVRAAVLGVYLHGRAGDLVAASRSYEGVTAGAIAESFGRAILEMFRKEPKQQKPNE